MSFGVTAWQNRPATFRSLARAGAGEMQFHNSNIVRTTAASPNSVGTARVRDANCISTPEFNFTYGETSGLRKEDILKLVLKNVSGNSG